MPTLIQFPKSPCEIDREWGHSVVALVNSKLSLNMDYPSPLTSARLSEPHGSASHGRERATLVEDFSDSGRLVPEDVPCPRSSTPVAAPITPTKTAAVVQPCSQARPGIDPAVPRHSTLIRIPQSQERFSFQQPSAHSLRMPDFFKRVFAPPNCLTPEIPSPERPVPVSESFIEREQKKNDFLERAIFGPHPGCAGSRARANKYITLPQATSLACRSYFAGSPPTVVASTGKDWCDLEHWRRDQALQESACIETMHSSRSKAFCEDSDEALFSSTSTGIADLFYSESCYSTIPETGDKNSPGTEGAAPIGLCRSSTNAEASLKASERKAQIDRDIQAFLESGLTPVPLSGTGTTKLSDEHDVAAAVPDVKRQTHVNLAVENTEVLQKSRSVIVSHFFPRQTIGKLKRSDNRRTLSIDSP